MCQQGKKITFCTCSAPPDGKKVPYIKSAKQNKRRGEGSLKQYEWKLSRFKSEGFFGMDGLMIMPADALDHDITSNSILYVLNNENAFDFGYVPAEGDAFEIHLRNSQDYLSFIFKEGEWVNDCYNVFYSKLTVINKGKVNIEG